MIYAFPYVGFFSLLLSLLLSLLILLIALPLLSRIVFRALQNVFEHCFLIVIPVPRSIVQCVYYREIGKDSLANAPCRTNSSSIIQAAWRDC